MITKIKYIDYNRVEVTYVEPMSGATVTDRYMAPSSGGYVWLETENREQVAQVCDGLYTIGNTLRWSASEPLIDLIRREWRRYKRNERRFFRA